MTSYLLTLLKQLSKNKSKEPGFVYEIQWTGLVQVQRPKTGILKRCLPPKSLQVWNMKDGQMQFPWRRGGASTMVCGPVQLLNFLISGELRCAEMSAISSLLLLEMQRACDKRVKIHTYLRTVHTGILDAPQMWFNHSRTKGCLWSFLSLFSLYLSVMWSR